MEEVEYHELDRWGWECKLCGGWNEMEDDPAYEETVFCEDCSKEYKPIEG